MPNNQFFNDWVTGEIITAEKLNQMKNDVQPYLGYTRVLVDQSSDVPTRYYPLGRVSGHFGFAKVRGFLGGHEIIQGRGNIDLQFTFRDGFRADGYAMGTMGHADILVVDPGDGWAYIYLVTQVYSLVSLELSGQGSAEIYYDGTYSNSAPSGNVLYRLSDDFANNAHPNVLKLNNGTLLTRYDHRDRFVVSVPLGGFGGEIIDPYSRVYITRTAVKIPAMKGLYLRRVRTHLEDGVALIVAGSSYTSPAEVGDFDLDVALYGGGNSDQIIVVDFGVYNNGNESFHIIGSNGYTAEFEIR